MSIGRRNALVGYPAYHSLAQMYGLPIVHKRFIADRFSQSSSLFQKDLQGHYGCVNAIDFSNKGGEFIVSGGDDRRILIWNLDKCLYHKGTPSAMIGEHVSNIFCTVFDSENRHIFSGGNDDQVIQHDVATGETVNVFPHIDPVYGLSVHPESDNIFLSAGDNGRVLLWDTRVAQSETPQDIARQPSAFHAAVFNPIDAHLVATANSKKGVELWDARVPNKSLQQYSSNIPQVCAMGVKWSGTGTYLTALRRHLPPVLYRIDRPSVLAEFSHPGYKNVCTMKSSCFGGDKDQYIISGSDDFNVYIWEVPELPEPDAELTTVSRAFLVLTGHRSIVNQVRFNPDSHLVVSTGVEKIVKVWSPFPIPSCRDSIEGVNMGTNPRDLFSHEDYLNLVMLSGRPLTHEYNEGTTEEDPRMLAFFDSLIQRETSGWDSESDENFSLDDFYLSFPQAESSGSDVDAEGITWRRLQQILAQRQRGQSESDDSQALYRRLRRLSREAVLRQLIGSDSESDSSSNSSINSGEEEEEGEPQQQVVLPDLSPTRTQPEEKPVEFRTYQVHRQRRYRVQRSSSDSSTTTNSEEISLENGHLTGNISGACSSVNCDKNLTDKRLTQVESSGEKDENMELSRCESNTNGECKTVAVTNGAAESSGKNDCTFVMNSSPTESENSDGLEEDSITDSDKLRQTYHQMEPSTSLKNPSQEDKVHTL